MKLQEWKPAGLRVTLLCSEVSFYGVLKTVSDLMSITGTLQQSEHWFCWRLVLLASGSASQRLVLLASGSAGVCWRLVLPASVWFWGWALHVELSGRSLEMSIWKCDDFIKDLSWTCLKGAVCKKSWFLSLSPDTSDTSDASDTSDTLDCTFKTYIKHCTFTTCVFLMMSFSPVVKLTLN